LFIHVTPMWPVQSGSRRRPAIALPALVSSGDSGHYTCHRVNAADGVVLGIDHHQVVVVVAADGLRGSPGRYEGWSAIAAVATLAGPGIGGHDAVGIDLADAIAFALTDVGIPVAIHAHGAGAQNTGRRRRTAITGAGFFSSSSKGGDDARMHIQ